MKNDNETKKRLLNSAKQEFLEKGYTTASLRNICRNAGVTTGALYFFFEDKEDLFGTIIKEPLDKISSVLKMHYEKEAIEFEKPTIYNHEITDDIKVAELVLDYLYEYHDEATLIIMKSQGSKYENCIEEFVSITEKHYRILSDKVSKIYNVEKLDDYIIHWFSHLQIFSFAQYIIHGLSKEEAKKQLGFFMKFMVAGWFGMFGIENSDH